MIETLKQASRLRAEAAQRTLDINEAYLMVHNAMALALHKIESAPDASKAVSLSRALAMALRQPRHPLEICCGVAR
jgi:hypothetical protein